MNFYIILENILTPHTTLRGLKLDIYILGNGKEGKFFQFIIRLITNMTSCMTRETIP